MGKCQKIGCDKVATKTRARWTTSDEVDYRIENEGISFKFEVYCYICDEHYNEAEKEYPLISDKVPYS